LRQKRPFAEPSIGQPSEGILRRRLWLCFGTDTAAKTAASLDTMFPEKTPALKFRNPVLSAFANAVWHCSSTAEVSIVRLAEDG
jgi:hypothetical protein